MAQPSPPADSRRLDAAERRVIARSRRHGLASVETTRRWRYQLRAHADPRLEALRRYVVLLRKGGDDWASEAAETMVRLGYSIEQIAHARWLIAHEAGPRQRTRASAALLLLAKAVLLAVLVAIDRSPLWPLVLVLGAAAIAAPDPAPLSKRAEWERNFFVV